ncbi:MAG: hypothetical protein ABIV50_15025, partial [Opitutus sp.]
LLIPYPYPTFPAAFLPFSSLFDDKEEAERDVETDGSARSVNKPALLLDNAFSVPVSQPLGIR